MDNYKIDFEFGWWVSMTPALLMAVYFIWHWSQQHNNLDLLISFGSVAGGIVLTSFICHPNAESAPESHESNRSKSLKFAEQRPAMISSTDPTITICQAGIVSRNLTVETAAGAEATCVDVSSTTGQPAVSLSVSGAAIPFPSSAVAAGTADDANLTSELPADTQLPSSKEAAEVFEYYDPISQMFLEINVATTTTTTTDQPRPQESASSKTEPSPAPNAQPKLTANARYIEPSPETKGWYSKGMTLMQSGKFRDALYCFSFVLQKEPEHVASLMAKAICHFQMRKYQDALKSFEQVAALDETDLRAREGIEASLKRLGPGFTAPATTSS